MKAFSLSLMCAVDVSSDDAHPARRPFAGFIKGFAGRSIKCRFQVEGSPGLSENSRGWW